MDLGINENGGNVDEVDHSGEESDDTEMTDRHFTSANQQLNIPNNTPSGIIVLRSFCTCYFGIRNEVCAINTCMFMVCTLLHAHLQVTIVNNCIVVCQTIQI